MRNNDVNGRPREAFTTALKGQTPATVARPSSDAFGGGRGAVDPESGPSGVGPNKEKAVLFRGPPVR